MNSKSKRLSIIIVTYNSEKDIFDCVSSIKEFCDIPLEEVELIVVDNQSRDPKPMFEKLRAMWSGIKIIENARNGGYGQGNNLGIRRSTAPVCMIMNPDVRLVEPIFEKALQIFDTQPHTAMLGMTQMFSSNKHSRHSFYPTWLMNGYVHLLLFALCNHLDWYLPQCMFLQGSCFFLRNDMFADAGMFDEENFMYGEEEDIHFRMKKLFGSSCFHYEKTLHYTHLAQNRVPSLDAEKRKLDANIALYQKKGIDAKTILSRYLQHYRLMLVRAKLSRSKNRAVLQQFCEHLKSLL